MCDIGIYACKYIYVIHKKGILLNKNFSSKTIVNVSTYLWIMKCFLL